ncbi:metallophosphoesterase family protein [Flaviaesturariibacter amylovorans]|uniref:Metallophosphoesterase family protein n=1 Tax=Flaviaesturariibacter amylovorans TaxID=1084520 RepID=A0ABP8GHA2_9BACT
MTRIGLFSDTHGWLDEQVWRHFEGCDELWHAGDFGPGVSELLQGDGRPVRGVYGNIDGRDIRQHYPEVLCWNCEGVRVYMKHIGGYPGRYAPGVKNALAQEGARLFISGHSHILKVVYDPKINCLHMNPGAAGRQGWHTVRTLLRFSIDGDQIQDLEVIELGSR